MSVHIPVLWVSYGYQYDAFGANWISVKTWYEEHDIGSHHGLVLFNFVSSGLTA
jgi:hypothetical protein